jgi:Synergist-CTERM protein sorting domain-containing protein
MRRKLYLVLSALMIFMLARGAAADIFYAVSNYNMGSVGVIRGSSHNGYVINSKLVTGYSGDSQGFSFHDHNGSLRALVRERSSGVGDSVWVYAPPNFTTPVFNRKGFGSNIHAIASDGDDLYLATYESYPVGPEDTGEVIHVNMKEGYSVKHRYHNPKFMYTGFLPAAGSVNWAWPHGEGVMVYNDKVYVMFGMSDPSKTIDYAPTEIVEFNRDLTLTGDKAVLYAAGPPAQIGKNSLTMAMHNGKLYVGCIGGRQGAGVYGDVWEVELGDPATQGDMTAKQVLDFENVTGVLAGAGWGAYGIDFTDDGTAFILAGGYNPSMDFKGRLFKIPAAELAKGGQDALDALEIVHNFTNASGHSWWDGVTWDAKSQTVWIMAGTHLFAFGKDGTYKKDFDPATLGEDIYSVAVFNEQFPSGVGGDIGDPPVPAGVTPADPNVEIVSSADVGIITLEENQTAFDVLSADLPEAVSRDLAAALKINKVGDEYLLEVDVPVIIDTMDLSDYLNINFEKILSPPAFIANTQNAGDTALVTMKMDFSRLAGYSFDKFMLFKLKNNGEMGKLTKVNSWEEMTDGTFIITDENGTPQSGAIEKKNYSYSVAIKDNGDYDWSTEPKVVIDPGLQAPESGLDYPENSGVGEGGMPGGCAAGTGGLAALAALALMTYRKKRR